MGDRQGLWYLTNSDNLAPRCLAPGIYGLSNASLDTAWPKVELGKAAMLTLLQHGRMSHGTLANIVTDADARSSWREHSFSAQGALIDVQQKEFELAED